MSAATLKGLVAACTDPCVQGLDVYVVGGAVRDALLGLPAGDRDWVVVGATPEQMVARDFIPVGGDFPVFLHPRTKEEYALARTERKSGRGYKGFIFYTGTDVTLEDDLQRRDLTVNAIAQTPDGRLIDPLDGQADVRNKVLRHVGHAFTEDPVRLLRLARFAARFHDFAIAPETMALACELVSNGEVDALVPERVWREVVKGLLTERPGRMFQVLTETGALARVLPGLEFNALIAQELATAAQAQLGVAGRFGILCRLSTSPTDLAKHVRAPTDCQDYARMLPLMLLALGRQAVSAQDELAGWLDLMEACDALRKPGHFLDLIATAGCVMDVNGADWQARVAALHSINAGAIAKVAKGRPDRIKLALREARLGALAALRL